MVLCLLIRAEPPMPMYMFLYARFSHVKIGIASWIPTTSGRAMQGQFPKNQSRILIPSPPTARRLEHKGSTLGLLVTTISRVSESFLQDAAQSRIVRDRRASLMMATRRAAKS
jgi:hypothetical protein